MIGQVPYKRLTIELGTLGEVKLFALAAVSRVAPREPGVRDWRVQ